MANQEEALAAPNSSAEELEKEVERYEASRYDLRTLGLPETAEQKLDRLEEEVNQLLTYEAQLSVALFKSDPAAFETLAAKLRGSRARVECLSGLLNNVINLEYPKIGFVQKCGLFFLAFLGRLREPVIMQTFAGNRGKRHALKQGVENLKQATNKNETIISQIFAEVEDLKLLPILPILNADRDYIKLCEEEDEVESDLQQLRDMQGDEELHEALIHKMYDRWIESDEYPEWIDDTCAEVISFLEAKLKRIFVAKKRHHLLAWQKVQVGSS